MLSTAPFRYSCADLWQYRFSGCMRWHVYAGLQALTRLDGVALGILSADMNTKEEGRDAHFYLNVYFLI